MANEKCVTAILVGAGHRGNGYATYAKIEPNKLKIIAVADPKKYARQKVKDTYNIPDDLVFSDWKEAAAQKKFADFVILTTQDQMHKEPAIAFSNLGYHILLEKPMSVSAEDCREIAKAAKENGIIMMVCHVLKYMPISNRIKALIEDGTIGELINIQLLEPDWKEAAAQKKFADFVILTTQDQMHKEPAIAFSNLGYHILLEKPMSVSAEDCREIAKAAKENGIIMMVCHVLKYMPISNRIKALIEDGTIGELINIQLLEPVGFWHYAHSYVRGNWHREEDSSSFLLAKCCHDIDLICYFMGKHRCTTVSSFGKLSHFTKENKPSNAASRCLHCPADVEQSCPFSARKIYLARSKNGYKGWPLSAVVDNPDVENLTDALLHGPYGKCVYDSDNDVMSHQVVNMQFDNGATASFTAVAFTEKICTRQLKIFGTKGEIRCSFDGPITHFDFNSNQTRTYQPNHNGLIPSELRGHGGADFFTIKSFVEAIQEQNPKKILTGVEESLASHLVVFAAEKARLENKVVTIHSDASFS